MELPHGLPVEGTRVKIVLGRSLASLECRNVELDCGFARLDGEVAIDPRVVTVRSAVIFDLNLAARRFVAGVMDVHLQETVGHPVDPGVQDGDVLSPLEEERFPVKRLVRHDRAGGSEGAGGPVLEVGEHQFLCRGISGRLSLRGGLPRQAGKSHEECHTANQSDGLFYFHVPFPFSRRSPARGFSVRLKKPKTPRNLAVWFAGSGLVHHALEHDTQVGGIDFQSLVES